MMQLSEDLINFPACLWEHTLSNRKDFGSATLHFSSYIEVGMNKIIMILLVK